jgi:hypothetical protein
MPASKNRKNGKDGGGGIAAAVNRQKQLEKQEKIDKPDKPDKLPEAAAAATAAAAAAAAPVETKTKPEHGPEEPPKKPEKPVESSKPTNESAKPVESKKPAEDAKPVDSKKPTEDAKPVDSKKPTEDAKPVKSKKPVESAKPVESKKPTKDAKPVESKKPAEDAQPVDSNAKAVDDKKPAERAEPAESKKPVESEKPLETPKVKHELEQSKEAPEPPPEQQPSRSKSELKPVGVSPQEAVEAIPDLDSLRRDAHPDNSLPIGTPDQPKHPKDKQALDQNIALDSSVGALEKTITLDQNNTLEQVIAVAKNNSPLANNSIIGSHALAGSTLTSTLVNNALSNNPLGSFAPEHVPGHAMMDRSQPKKGPYNAPTAARSPEFRPSAGPYNAIPIISPSLDAVSAPSVAGSAAPSMADWRSGLAGSPSNLVLLGESPPTQPSSYEDSGRLNRGWAARSPVGSYGASPPPSHARRPMSIIDPARASADRFSDYRRGSMHSHASHARSGSHPFASGAPPHQAQPHFYGAPDIDFGALAPQSGIKAGERGYFFGFDTLPESSLLALPSAAASIHGAAADAGPTDAVLAGYEGGLEVYALSKRGLDPVGSLKGLRGGVYGAKMLPWTPESDAAGLYPLVAVVVHGPALPAADDAAPEADASMPGSPRAESVFRGTGPLIDAYQTTVEVHSLAKNKLLSVLLVAPRVPINTTVSLLSPLFKPPPPTGALQVKADAGTVVVASGASGEAWVYRQFAGDANTFRFACVAKLWAAIQHTPRGAKPEEDIAAAAAERGDPLHATPPRSPPAPIITINGRWIAYCPAAPSSHMTLRAHVPASVYGKAPGLATVTPPALPTVTTSLDVPLAESVVNRIMRETTQELISGAKWVGQQGMQAWNAYWNRPAAGGSGGGGGSSNGSSSSQQPARSPPGAQWAMPSRNHDGGQFPPTHAVGEAATKDPGLVSILDLETLAASSSLHPLATFALPLGCSFLSFSPNGLALFTASLKGDVQTVWDLMRIQHTKTSALGSGSGAGPCVRQVAQFSRMTVARIVDVAWVRPRGQRLAMVTERGTVHLMDLSSNAFSWPPPRRRRPAETAAAVAAAAATTTSATTSSTSLNVAPEQTQQPKHAGSAAVSMATTAFGAALGVAKPLISRQRRSSGPSSGMAAGGAAFVDSANHGGRAIAATISNSLGKTGSAINQLRQNAENRVSLPSGGLPPTAHCVAWAAGRRSAALCVVGDGVVRMFAPRPSRRSSGGGAAAQRRGSKYHNFRVPSLPDGAVSSLVKHFLESGTLDDFLELSDRDRDRDNDDGGGMMSANTLTLDPTRGGARCGMTAEAAIPHAEIESSAPYQPFHTDRRVALLEARPAPPALIERMSGLSLGGSQGRQGVSSLSPLPKAWAFGRALPAVRLTPVHADDGQHRALPTFAMERVMHMAPNDDEIVVTTRKRRHVARAQGDGDDDGFFEDDCEVLDFADQRV